MMNENLKSVQAAAKGTSDVLSKGIEDAKRDLDDHGCQAGGVQEEPIRGSFRAMKKQSEDPDWR